ncbi:MULTISPECIES: RDD family protein [Bacillus]|uniref:RDD domain-containing protein n=2 Tax=Bacillus TaxID=1386 RepID=A0A0M4FRC0_9BACI|nr:MULTISPECIES: RDD family protein [Bacillus]ALC82023.1 hypothetical protein AM592_10710 [Bacillus gobiensis]MBP1083365.1 putative RDD family membrane protein YckC [Bacillus capparidis]MED1097797.1 RDD family protein [Bacillus capparidis]
MDSTFDDGNPVKEASHETAHDTRNFETEHAYAGFWIRFWAYLLDGIVVWGITNLTVEPLFTLLNLEKKVGLFTISPYTVSISILFLLYFFLMTFFFHQTLGKMVFGLKVISIGKEKELTWSSLLFREVIGRYIHNFAFLYIVVGVTPKKQGIHDFFADTTVIHEKLYKKQ